VVLKFEWSVLELTLFGRYCTAGGQRYYSLNRVCYTEQYVEGTSRHVYCGIAVWMECVTVNIIWKIQHIRGESVIVGWMDCVTDKIICKVLHSRWSVVWQVEWIVLQLTLCGNYCTRCWLWNCRFNGVWFSEQYLENTAQQGVEWYCSLDGVCYS